MARIKVLAPLVPGGDGRTIKQEGKRADPFYSSEENKKYRKPCSIERAIAANGPRMGSAARKRHHVTDYSPTTSRIGATAAIPSIRTTACACADRITPSRPSASARADWPRAQEGEGAKFLAASTPANRSGPQPGIFFSWVKFSTCSATRCLPIGGSGDGPNISRRSKTGIASAC
jgi:hypothetical protein